MTVAHPHRRYDPLGDRWVQVSPDRTDRPWQGEEAEPEFERPPEWDPHCFLCPGNTRAGGETNPPYRGTFVFTNDFPALDPDAPTGPLPGPGRLRAESAPGTCRVVCFAPRHDLTLAEMGVDGLRQVIDTFASQTEELGRDYRWVQVFENRGEAMGASSPHPHGQIWAVDALPTLAATEDRTQAEHHAGHGVRLLDEYAQLEAAEEERVVAANDEWLAVVPWWAHWPFETLVIPRRPVPRLPDLDDIARDDLAALLDVLLVKYDNLFRHPFPYSMGWHGAPGSTAAEHWTLHAHLHPPMLRSATVRKYVVGYEMFAEVERDLTPEAAAGRLRELSDTHYRFFGGR